VGIKTEDELAGCPVQHTDYRVDRPAMAHFDLLDADREAARFYFNDTTPRGFWVLTRHEDVLEAAQRHDLFSNQQVSAFDPNLPPGYFLPNSLDQPEHSKFRRVLNPYFSPAAVKRMLPLAQERATAIILELKERGGCEFNTDFAARYPTEVFMELLGLPVEDGVMFLPWNDAIFNGFFDTSPAAAQARDDGHANVIAYFDQMVDDRTRSPRDPDTDLETRLITCEIDGQRLDRQTILNLCFTLNLAGLDTTKSALSYLTFYLANHPDVRSRLLSEPDLWPRAIEELTLLQMKVNDVVWLGFAQASRDPRTFENAADFDLDRENVNRHLSFGAGIHRCIGMHLARAEMDIALRTWHEHIPQYRVAAGSEIVERGGQLSLKSLPLEWP
jgi:cytochrome P450